MSKKFKIGPGCFAKRMAFFAAMSLLLLPASFAGFHIPDTTLALAAQSSPLAPVWQGLLQQFVRDGVNAEAAQQLLATLPPYPTPDPMGKKIRELYRREFMPETIKKVKSDTYYKGVVTEANARECREYIALHKNAFLNAQARYGVPPSIAAALLFVETRLGRVLADVPENAFYVLASMAVTTTPHGLGVWLEKIPGYQSHLTWLDNTLKKRSQWAYNEVLALVRHMIVDKIPPDRLPGSIYGAVGLCQFMPSNISVYGADGNGDGSIDLFKPEDAIASLANYLARHGWKHGIGARARHKCLMTYNHSQVYANTIMALASLIEGHSARPGHSSGTGKKK